MAVSEQVCSISSLVIRSGELSVLCVLKSEAAMFVGRSACWEIESVCCCDVTMREQQCFILQWNSCVKCFESIDFSLEKSHQFSLVRL